jgi:hypothetical protein
MASLPISVFLIELPLWKNCAGLPFVCQGALHGREQEQDGWLYKGQHQPCSVVMRCSRSRRRRTSISYRMCTSSFLVKLQTMYTNSARTNTYSCASTVIVPCRHLPYFPIKLQDPLSLYRETHFILVIFRLVALCKNSIDFFFM